jgi:hypothetical protein
VASDEVIYLRSAGVDIGKRFVVACVRTPSARGGRWVLETEQFDTTPPALRELSGWLAERMVDVVVLAATGDYWRPVFYRLQDAGLNLLLANEGLSGFVGFATCRMREWRFQALALSRLIRNSAGTRACRSPSAYSAEWPGFSPSTAMMTIRLRSTYTRQ